MSAPRSILFVPARTWAAVGMLAGVVLVSVLLVWQLSADARREINALATASTDSAHWTLAQTEVELLALESAVLAARAGTGDLDEIRRRFDVFYSRVQTVLTSRHFDGVLGVAEVDEAVAAAEAFLSDYVAVIDGPDPGLEAALPALTRSLAEMRDVTRAFSLASIRVMSQRSAVRRGQVSDALTDLGLISVSLLAVLLALVAALLWMMRAARRQAGELALAHGRMEAMISTSLDAIVVVGRDGRILDFNGAAERIFGYSRAEALGADMGRLLLPDPLRAAHQKGMDGYSQGRDRKVVGRGLMQHEAMRKDGTIFPVEFSTNAAKSGDGEIFVSYLRDISHRVEARRELVAARDSAVAGEKAKATLLAVMSHEMRTPLNGVLGTLQLLGATDLDPCQRGYVEMMHSSGELLLEHVNDVLDISRLDAGRAETVTRSFDLPALARDVTASLETQARERGNTITLDLRGPGLATVSGDPARLKQILFNLVGNAIKFTENGKITVELERDPGTDVVEFRVIDTGIGIAPDDVDHVFDDFVTLDTSFQRAVEGTGLGLGIVRRLVELLGGTVGVESIPGDGSAFWFRLPLPDTPARRRMQPPAPAVQPPDPVARARVLLVEDNDINRLVAREMFELCGCSVTEAHDGQDGVDRASAEAFDLILMDISMPRLDGIEASRRIRASTGPNASTPIVALTAHALEADRERFHAAGMVDVIAKPLAFETVEALVARTLGAEVAAANSVRPDSAGGTTVIGALEPQRARDIRARMQRELKTGLAALRAMLADPDRIDRDAFAARAHKLIGTAAFGGFDPVCDALRAVEAAAAEAPPPVLAGLVDAAAAAHPPIRPDA